MMSTAEERESVAAGHAAELWNLKTVISRTGLSRSTLYAYVNSGLFPRQRVLGPRRVGWLAADVCRWITTRPTQAHSQQYDASTDVGIRRGARPRHRRGRLLMRGGTLE
jgi:predicted DNA-binding transcriptional regulator AlpA